MGASLTHLVLDTWEGTDRPLLSESSLSQWKQTGEGVIMLLLASATYRVHVFSHISTVCSNHSPLCLLW